MKNTTLCYIRWDDLYLMLYRDKKEYDQSQGKYLGVGGKFLEGETPEECVIREVREETGFKLVEYEFRGVVHFRSDIWDDEDMYLFSATGFEVPAETPLIDGMPLPECDEGTFQWVPEDKLLDLPMWEGDRHFLTAMAQGEHDIEMTLRYEGDTLVEVRL